MVITRDHKHIRVAREPGGAPSKATFLSSLVLLLQGRRGWGVLEGNIGVQSK